MYIYHLSIMWYGILESLYSTKYESNILILAKLEMSVVWVPNIFFLVMRLASSICRGSSADAFPR